MQSIHIRAIAVLVGRRLPHNITVRNNIINDPDNKYGKKNN